MTIDFSAIHFPAVLAAAAATFMLGALWYTALFGKLWVRLHGYSPEKIEAMQGKTPPAIFFGGMFFCDLLIALVIAILITSLHIDTAGDGALLGLIVWLAAAAIRMTNHLASDKPIGLYLIDVGYQLVYLVMMGAILGYWR